VLNRLGSEHSGLPRSSAASQSKALAEHEVPGVFEEHGGSAFGKGGAKLIRGL
jgi:hypothetical protein